jgi:hypothetical protein
MTTKKYYNEWNKFIIEYDKYFIEMYGTAQIEKITNFMSAKQLEEYEWNTTWNKTFTELREFVDINNKLPVLELDINKKEFELFKWYELQNQRYNKRICWLNNIKIHFTIKMMSQTEYEEWKKFIEVYELKLNCKLIISETEWLDFYFQKLKEFIDTNNRLPLQEHCRLQENCYYENKLSDWLSNNWSNANIEPLKQEYKEYFVSNFEIFYASNHYLIHCNWDAEFSHLKKFLFLNKRKLNGENINEKEKLKWLYRYSNHLKCNMFPFCKSNENAIKLFTDFLEEYNKLN